MLKVESNGFNLDFSGLTKENEVKVSPETGDNLYTSTEEPKKRRTRKTGPTVPVKSNTVESNYNDSYNENNIALRGLIHDIDITQNMIDEDLIKVRKAKTLNNKYNYTTSMYTSKSQLFGSKISALKEMSNNITNAHKLELSRQKELKAQQMEEGKNVARDVTDLYRSFVSTPRKEIPNFVNEQMVNTGGIIGVNSIETGNHVVPQGVSPQQNMMILEKMNPNVKTVVKYDRMSGRKWFDVVDMITGQSIENVDLPNPMLLEDIKIDTHGQIARDDNLNRNYPLIVI